jgi:two-component system, LytTR family, response regulator
MLRALLIDDEPDARADLRISLAAHAAEVAIAAEAETLDEAEALLSTGAYDVVFLDVQLRGGTGFDLVPRIRPDARIVFVTAHDNYALRAFEVNALDYLLKPIAPDRLAAAVTRVVAALARAQEAERSGG